MDWSSIMVALIIIGITVYVGVLVADQEIKAAAECEREYGNCTGLNSPIVMVVL